MRDRARELRAAATLARERFSALQAAFNTMESAHKRGDYSPCPELAQRLDEFRGAASEVQRLAAEFISESGTSHDPDRTE